MSLFLEQPRREKESTKGNSAVREFVANWADRWDNSLPKLGDVYPDNSFLYCTAREPSQNKDGLAVILYTYENEGQLSEEFYEYNADFSAEVLDTTKGMTWENAGTKVDIPISTIHPIVTEVITVRALTSPREALRTAVGKVNDRKFHGAEAGHLLLEGASVRISRDQNGTIISAQSTFRFLWRDQEHNEVWREARQKKRDGIWLEYQNTKPEDTETYSLTEPPGDPVYYDGIQGTSDWDKPYRMDGTTKFYRYKECDFGTVLGLPIETGDDPIGDPEP